MNQPPGDKDKEDAAQNRTDPSEPLVPLQGSRQTIQNCQTTNSSKNHGHSEKKISWPSRIQIAATVAIVFITLFYTHYASQQVEQMRRAVDVAQKQLVASERPWLSAKISISRPLKFIENAGSIGITGVIKNTGHSPALDVRFNVQVILNAQSIAYIGDESILHQRQVEYGDFWKSRQSRSIRRVLPQSIIFPGEERTEEQVTRINADEIQKGLSTTPVKGGICPVLIVCIDYLFSSVDPESARPEDHHQTWYSYPLGIPFEAEGFAAAYKACFEPSGTPSGVVLIGAMMSEFAN